MLSAHSQESAGIITGQLIEKQVEQHNQQIDAVI